MHPQAQSTRLFAISDLREQERVCGGELVGMIVCDEWMCCGVDVVMGGSQYRTLACTLGVL